MAQSPTLPGVPQELAAEQFELTLRRLADDLTYGSDPSRFVGVGTDFAQSRPFVFGDSVRHIDWRVTARTGRVHVKEYEATKRTGMFLLVDTSASMGVTSVAVSKHDAAVWIAGVLALVALKRRSPVAILCAGERESRPTPTLSRGQVWRWIEELRRSSTTEGTRLAGRLAQVEAIALHTSSVIVLSDLHDPGAPAAIKRIAQRHDCLVFHLQDPAEARGLRAGFVRGREAETGVRFLAGPGSKWPGERHEAELRDAGVHYTLVRTDRPIIPVVRRALEVHGGGLRKAR